jgi:hypothetical protein
LQQRLSPLVLVVVLVLVLEITAIEHEDAKE